MSTSTPAPNLTALVPETGGSDDFISFLGPPTPQTPISTTPSTPPPPIIPLATPQPQPIPTFGSPETPAPAAPAPPPPIIPIMVTTPVEPPPPPPVTAPKIIPSTSGTVIEAKPARPEWVTFFLYLIVFLILGLALALIGYYFLKNVDLSQLSLGVIIPAGLLILGIFLILGGYLLQKK